jgi:hypothetical protein
MSTKFRRSVASIRRVEEVMKNLLTEAHCLRFEVPMTDNKNIMIVRDVTLFRLAPASALRS